MKSGIIGFIIGALLMAIGWYWWPDKYYYQCTQIKISPHKEIYRIPSHGGTDT